MTSTVPDANMSGERRSGGQVGASPGHRTWQHPLNPRGDDEPWCTVDPAELVDYVLSLVERPSWWARAACRGAGVDMFATTAVGIAAAVAVCQRCPVIEPCGEAGASERHGVWAGQDRKSRGHRKAA